MVALQRQIVTAEQFEDFIYLPENQDRRFEFIGGEILELVSNNYSSMVAMLVGGMLMVFVKAKALGWVTGADGGYIVAGERYIPDVAFIALTRLPQPSHEAYNPNAPDLAVEVLSPTDQESKLRIKVVNYLRAGTTVWVVDPQQKLVEVFSPEQAPIILGLEDTLEGGQLLPDFSLPVKDIFPE